MKSHFLAQFVALVSIPVICSLQIDTAMAHGGGGGGGGGAATGGGGGHAGGPGGAPGGAGSAGVRAGGGASPHGYGISRGYYGYGYGFGNGGYGYGAPYGSSYANGDVDGVPPSDTDLDDFNRQHDAQRVSRSGQSLIKNYGRSTGAVYVQRQ